MYLKFMRNVQSGLTLVELLISMALGLIVIVAAASLLMSSQRTYIVQDEAAILQESGRFAIETISRAIRQAGYENWELENAAAITSAEMTPNIYGLDGQTLKSTTNALEFPLPKSPNGSDILALRYFGSGAGAQGDGSIINCAGFTIAEPASGRKDEERAWSIFYTANDSLGEPELRCKYLGKSGWTSDAIIRGVESFQVLYGLDSDQDGLVNRYVNATEINELDDALVLVGTDKNAQISDRNAKSHWKKIVTIKVSVLVRGSAHSRTDDLTRQYDLFPKEYCDANAATDPGIRITENLLPKSTRNRSRMVFSATIRVRNGGSVASI